MRKATRVFHLELDFSQSVKVKSWNMKITTILICLESEFTSFAIY